MALIEAQTIGEAHEATIRLLLEEGLEQSIETEPGKIMKTWELPDPLLVVIREPATSPQVSGALPYGEGMLKKYMADLLTVGPTGFEYTYANRLMDYPVKASVGNLGHLRMVGNGDGKGIDQIEQVIARLVESPNSRRALAITWVPEWDGTSVEPPCLQFLHFMIRGGRLHCRAAFRSHDMLLGAGPNWLALYGVMVYVAKRLNEIRDERIITGSLSTLSSSAHIYVDAQSEELRAFKRVLRMA